MHTISKGDSRMAAMDKKTLHILAMAALAGAKKYHSENPNKPKDERKGLTTDEKKRELPKQRE